MLVPNRDKSKLPIDPRTKILLMIFTNFVIFNGAPLSYSLAMALIPFGLLVLEKKYHFALISATAFIFSGLTFVYLMPYLTGLAATFLLMPIYTLYRLMPCLIMGGYIITTTTVSEFIASMERIHIPQAIIIPFAVMFRFFPTVLDEKHAINNAMRMRGISFGGRQFLQNPFAMLEYRLIPLLISITKIGDELSAAALTRGLGGPNKRTNICQIGFYFQDILLLAYTGSILLMYLMKGCSPLENLFS